MDVGDRVGAIFSRDRGGTVRFLGFGVYQGDFVPGSAVGELADGLRQKEQTNAKILLDSGQVVWGCECWWDDEDVIRQELDSADTVITLDIDEVRQVYWEESESD